MNAMLDKENTIKPLSVGGSALLFGIPAVYFQAVTKYLIPYFRDGLHLHPAMSWFCGALIVFVPLFTLALMLVKREGYKLSRQELFTRLRIRRVTSSDMKWVFVALLVIFSLTGAIIYAFDLAAAWFNLPPLEMSPDFTKFSPLAGNERWLLLVWLIMFFFNIVGEEILWRGYILPRQEKEHGRYAWMFNSMFWVLFHICFGVNLMIVLLPCLLVVPYVVYRTGNTMNGILIHGIYNGPLFVMVALGVIK